MDDLDEFPDVEEVDIYDDDLANLLSSSDDARGRGRRRGGGTGRGASRERGLDSDEDEYDEDLEGLVPRGGGDDDDDAREEAVPEAAGTDIHNASSGFYIAGKQLPKIPKEVECYTFNISNDPKAPLMMDGYNCKGTEQLQSTLEVLMNEDDEKIKDPPYVERTLRRSCCCPLRRPPRARAATASSFFCTLALLLANSRGLFSGTVRSTCTWTTTSSWTARTSARSGSSCPTRTTRPRACAGSASRSSGRPATPASSSPCPSRSSRTAEKTSASRAA